MSDSARQRAQARAGEFCTRCGHHLVFHGLDEHETCMLPRQPFEPPTVAAVSPELRVLADRVARSLRESRPKTDAEIDAWAMKLAREVAHADD